MQEAGEHTVLFKKDNLPAGIYYYNISGKDFSEMKKMVSIN